MDLGAFPISIQMLTGIVSVASCLDALLSVEGSQMEAWWRMMDWNLEMRFTLHSSPLSGRDTTLGLQIPHHSSWPRKHRRLRKADPLRTWCQCRQDNSLVPSPPL